MESPSVEGAKRKPHILIVAIAFPGHCGPFIQILYHLAELHEGITVTVWGTEERIDDLAKIQERGDLSSLDLRLVKVLGPVPVYLPDPKFPVRGPIVAEINRKECEAVMRELIELKDSNAGPTVVIGDMLQYWSKDLADELGVPWWSYWSVRPSYVVSSVKSGDLIRDGLQIDPKAPNPNNLLTTVPGLAHVRMGDLPTEAYEFHDTYSKMGDRARRATGVLLNTSEELEASCGTLAALRALLPSVEVLPVGPSLQYPGYGSVYSPTDSKSNCLHWLDTKPASTVLYISFGSLGSILKENVVDLAVGLEASGVSFLWALKPGSFAVSDLLPAGFEQRTKDRGLVESGWAPQSRILAHSSIGGFLSHCGWNSALESFVSGVPLIGWPLSADQHMAVRFIADVVKAGLNIADSKPKYRDNFDDIGREEVEKSINLLMYEEEGRQVRRNVLNLQKSLAKAVAKGGSSYQNLHYFLDQLVSVRQ